MDKEVAVCYNQFQLYFSFVCSNLLILYSTENGI